jgi:hypothetical protein
MLYPPLCKQVDSVPEAWGSTIYTTEPLPKLTAEMV